jgi:nucleoside phosphorylase
MEPIFLSNDALPPEKGQITLNVLSKPEKPLILESHTYNFPIPEITEKSAYRGSADLTPETSMTVDGHITLNPNGGQVIALPPSNHKQPLDIFAPDRSKWDLYLVIMPFTLHPLHTKGSYERFDFFVAIEEPQETTAYDLFPKQVLTTPLSPTTYTVSPQGKFQELSYTPPTMQPSFTLKMLHPNILSYGEGEARFYWRYEEEKHHAGVIPETKHALFVLQVPTGTTTVKGTFRCEAIIASLTLNLYTRKKASVNTFSFHWQLTPTSHKPPKLPIPSLLQTSIHPAPYFDVCLICALAEEAKELISEFTRQCHVSFQENYHPTLKRAYRQTVIQNQYDEPLHILLCWQPSPGAVETSLLLEGLIRSFKPQFVGMTGLCAGDQTLVALGDLVVAERTFSYDSGMLIRDASGLQVYQHATTTWQPRPEILHSLRMFTEWQSGLATLPRPLSLHQQRDWLLSTLYKLPSHHFDDIPPKDLERYAPLWRKILTLLRNDSEPWLSRDRILVSPARVKDLYYGPTNFPYLDPSQPIIHIKPIASGNTERADNPFAEIRYPVQDTVAIDLEGSTFYRTLADFPEIPSLLVKGVGDYADSVHDETYRSYASAASAAYMLSFLQTYIRPKKNEQE